MNDLRPVPVELKSLPDILKLNFQLTTGFVWMGNSGWPLTLEGATIGTALVL